VTRSSGLRTAALIAVLNWSAALAADHAPALDSYALQHDFSTAKDLIIEPRWQALDKDAAAPLTHVGRQIVGAKPGFANLGEEWSPGDALRPDVPRALHLFSAYSDNVVGNVFLVGGRETMIFALLARRHAKDFCIFKLPPITLTNLRVSVVQEILKPGRDEVIGPIPKCQAQSLDRPVQFPDA
jgi:hypothetical protein